jgi:hypothetical protein
MDNICIGTDNNQQQATLSSPSPTQLMTEQQLQSKPGSTYMRRFQHEAHTHEGTQLHSRSCEYEGGRAPLRALAV